MSRHSIGILLVLTLTIATTAIAEPVPDLAPAPALRPSQPAPRPEAPGIRCQAFYRASVSQPIQGRKTLIFGLDRGPRQSAEFEDLGLQAFFSDDPHEGRSLILDAVRTDTGRALFRHLYQIPRGTLPENQFVGQHGFSGLVYVWHPESEAELQFICETMGR